MSLRNQFITVILSILALVFIGTFFISVDSFKAYLNNHLHQQMTSVANTLGSAVAQADKPPEKARLSRAMDKMFEQGIYQEISVEFNNNILYEREKSSSTVSVPRWFQYFFPIEILPVTEDITSPNNITGSVTVIADLADAYEKLWGESVATLWWFMACAVIMVFISMLLLNLLLKPLALVKHQADAICDRKFSVQQHIPHTPELRSVVTAMNRMSTKVRSMFDEQNDLTDRLREQVYKNELTGLGNRRFFYMQLDHLIYSEDEFFQGALFIIEFRGISSYKKKHGFEATVKHIKDIAKVLNEISHTNDKFMAGHFSDQSFALLTPDISLDEIKSLADTLSKRMDAINTSIADTEITTNIGIATYRKGGTSTDLLSEADMALRAAQANDKENWHIYTTELDKDDIMSATQWKKTLTKAIETKDIILHYQPVLNNKTKARKPLHYEVLMRLPAKEGELYNASVFVPMAETFNMMVDFDKIVIEKLIDAIKKDKKHKHKYAFNLSAHTLDDHGFADWLKELFNKNKTIAKRLILEIPEAAVLNAMTNFNHLVAELGPLGCEFSLDHFGRGFSSFQYLSTLNVNYIKIDGCFIRNIDKDIDNQFFLHVLTEIAHTVDIKVIAENIEKETELKALRETVIDGLQGYIIGKPTAEPSSA